MKIPEIKAICKRVTRIITKTGTDGKTIRLQSLIVTVAGYVDSFGDKKAKDEDWEIQIINENIEKFDLLGKNLEGKKLLVNAWLNSRSYKKDGEEAYMLGLRLNTVEIYEPK